MSDDGASETAPDEGTRAGTRQAALRGSSALVLAAMVSRLLSLLSMLFLTRLCSVTELGAFAAAFGLVFVLAKLTNFEARRDIMREPHRAAPKARAYVQVQGCLAWALAVLLCLIGPWIGRWWGQDEQDPLLAGQLVQALAFYPFFDSLGLPAMALLEARMRFRAMAWIEAGAMLLQVGTGILLAAMGFGSWSLVAAFYTGCLCRGALAWVCVGQEILGTRASRLEYASLVRFGLPMLMAHLSISGSMNLPEVLLGGFTTMAMVGVYKCAYLLPHAAEQAIEQLSRVGLAVLGHHEGKEHRARVFGLSARFVFGLMLPGFLLSLMHGEFLLEQLLGEEYVAGSTMLTLLAAMVVLRASLVGWRDLASVLGRPGHLTRAGIATLVFLVLLSVPMADRWGGEGMAGAVFLAWTLPMPWIWRFVQAETGLGPASVYGPGLAAGALALATGSLAEALLSGGILARTTTIGLQLLVYGITWLRLDPELFRLVLEGFRRPAKA